MAEKLEKTEAVSVEDALQMEILVNQALIDILVDKGILTYDEILKRVEEGRMRKILLLAVAVLVMVNCDKPSISASRVSDWGLEFTPVSVVNPASGLVTVYGLELFAPEDTNPISEMV